jgi:hypothetical protein
MNFYKNLYKVFNLCLFFFALVLTAGVLENEVSFNIEDLSFSQLKGYDLVKLEGCELTVEVGAPLLPRASFSLLIPQGAEVVNIEVVSVDKEEITGEYDIYPTQHPQPFLKGKVFPFVEPDEDIYSQTVPYPEKIIHSTHTGSMGGFRLTSVLIYPLQYIPQEKKLIFYSRIRFKVTYEDKLRTLNKKTEKQNKIFKERVGKLILNPEDIGMSEPSIGLRGSLDLSPDTIEYVIITTDSFTTSFQELANWKTKKGIPAKVITLDYIYANYTGADNAERIRNFIIDANSSWGTIWVLLGGQCDYEWGQEIVPRRNVWYRTVDGDETDTIPTDLYFSDLDGNWNADGDNVYGESTDDVDLYSDVFVGRAPVRTIAQAETFVNKVLTYEKRPPYGYQKKILLPAAYLWPSSYDERISQEAIADIVPGDWQVSRMYERDGNLTHTAFVDSVQAGFGFAHLVGHGNQNGIYTYYADAYLNSADLDTLGNGSLLGIHNSIGCMCGALDYVPYGDCFAEHYLTPSTGGSYSIMNSRYGWGQPPNMGPSENIDTCFYHEIFTEDYAYHDHLGAAHAFSKNGYVSRVTWGSVWAWCIYELNLFGDPELPLWTDNPGELTVTHDAVIPVGGSSFSVNVTDGGFGVEGALVCLYKEGEVYKRGYTDASGNITLTLSPPPISLGIMHCTATKNNYIPYEGTVDVISPSGPWVIFEHYTVIDASGNSDGNVDPGESIELPLTVHNVGLGDALSVTGIIRTEDPYVTLIDSIEDFGNILADSIAASLEDFDFDVLSECPANHVINFELLASDINDSTWNSYFSVPISTPDISLLPDTLNFDTVYIGYPDTLELMVNNVGTDTLRVSSITSDNIDYSVDMSNFNIPPGESQAVGVIFSPASEVLSTGNLTLECNDLDEPSLTVFLEGEGLLPPDISVSPDSLSDSLYTGETSTHTLTIYNNGASNLNFDILIEELDTSTSPVDFFADKSVRNHKVVAFGKPVSLDELKDEAFSFPPKSTEVSDDFIDKDKPFQSNNSDIAARSLAIGEEIFGNDDNMYSAGPRTRGNIFTCENSTTLIEHRLYINPSVSTQLWFLVYEGESQVGTYNLISASDVTPAGPGLGWYSSGEVNVPLEEGKYYLIVASFEELSSYYNQQGIPPYPIPASFGELTAGAGWNWAPTTSFPPQATQNVPSYAFGDPVAYYQTLVTGRWIDSDSTQGSISANDSFQIEVTFDATGLNGGDYFADIIIASNDPDESEVIVPAHLHVIGAPDITVSADTLDYGTIFNGYSATDTLAVSNEGTDLLTVSDIASDNSDYTIDTTNLTLNPEETQEIVVTFMPSTLGTITGNLTITSDDPDEPTLTVFLQGECVEPPIITINPHHIGDTLFTGDSTTHILTIENIGTSNLLFEIFEEESDSIISYKKSPYISARFKNKNTLSNISQNFAAQKAIKEISEVLIHNQKNQTTGYSQPLAGTYTGDYLSFGLTDYGEIMPFQCPVGVEHLQVGGYYSGYTVCYNDGADHVAYAGYQTRSGIVPVSYTEVSNTVDEAVIDVVTQANGGELTITQRFTFNKRDKFIRVVANIENTSGDLLNNVVFKSWADWDMDNDYGDDNWDYDSSYNMIYAWDTHYGTIAGEKTPDYRDIEGWDDFNRRITDEDITEGPLTHYDGLEILHYEMGDLVQGEESFISFTYASADNLSELQDIVERSLENVKWLSENPDTGTVTSGSSIEVEVKFDADGMYVGNYYANLIVASNDPAISTDTVSCFMHVTGAPDITISEDTLDYGIVFSGYSSIDTLTISNEGTDSLTVSDISSDMSDYTVNTTNFVLNPGESQDVVVTFTPSSTGIITGNLTITSDDPDNPNLTVFLRGECVEPPDISVSPNSLSDTLLPGETSTDTLIIYNTGESDLNFNISSEEAAGILTNKMQVRSRKFLGTRSGEKLTPQLSIESSDKLYISGSPVAIGAPSGIKLTPQEYKGSSDKPYISGRPASRVKINPGEIKLGNKMAIDIRLLILKSGGDVSEMQSLLLSFPDISVVDVFDAYSATPSLATLLEYDCVISANNYPFDNPTALGNVLADYVDTEGGVILTVPSLASGYSIQGRLLDEGYMPFNIGSGPIGPLNLGSFNANHSIMTGVMAAVGDAITEISIATGAELIAQWDNGFPFITTKGSNVAGINIYFGNTGYWTGDIPLILHNTAFWTFAVSWLYCNITSGIIPTGDSAFVEITFDATDLSGGDYYANIIVSSNDPDEPEVIVPSHLHITGVPDIAVSADTLDYGIVFPGYSSSDTLIVSNEGTDPLTVNDISSDNSDYTVDTTNFILNPGETQDLVVTFTPSSAGIITGNLAIISDDPVDPTLAICLMGECIDPPVISIVPNSLSDTLNQAEISTHTLTIYNTGVMDLIFDISIGGALLSSLSTNKKPYGNISLSSQFEYLEVEKGEVDPRKGNPVVLSAGGPDSFGYTWIDSDEGGGCQFDWADISSTGIQVTGLSDDNFVGPYPINFDFPFYDSVYTEFYISSNGFIGFGPTSDYFSLSDQPIPTRNSPNNIIAWCWDDLYPYGSVYYEDSGDKLTIQFVDYGEYGANGRINAELILHRSGQIIIQYLNTYNGFDIAGNAVGIENINGRDGLQVAFNTDYIHDSLAVKFTIGPKWLSVTPVSDTISSGDSLSVEVTFGATGMSVGDHSADIIISSNDPENPEISVLSHLHVLSAGIEEEIPKVFFVKQNYPNPFSANTVIQFGCPEPANVRLLIYDVMGRVVTVLIDNKVEAGYHSVNWNGTTKSGRKIANAVYFYRLETDKGFNQTKKMIHLR